KGALDRFELRTELLAEERRCREIERQLLNGWIEFERAPARPMRQTFGDAGIELAEIRLHRAGFEGDREGAPVQAMLVEIEQHQPAWKQAPEQYAPPQCGREQFLAVKQHELVGFRAEQRNVALAEGVAAIDQTISFRPLLDETLGIGEHNERMTNQRPAIVAGNMRQRACGRRLVAVRRSIAGTERLHRHCAGPHSGPPQGVASSGRARGARRIASEYRMKPCPHPRPETETARPRRSSQHAERSMRRFGCHRWVLTTCVSVRPSPSTKSQNFLLSVTNYLVRAKLAAIPQAFARLNKTAPHSPMTR